MTDTTKELVNDARAWIATQDKESKGRHLAEILTDALERATAPTAPAIETQDASDAASDRYQGDWDPVEEQPVDDWCYSDAQRKAFVAGADWRDQHPAGRRISKARFDIARGHLVAAWSAVGRMPSPTLAKKGLTAALASLGIEVDRG